MEEFTMRARDLLAKLERQKLEFQSNHFADDVTGAKTLVETHNDYKRFIVEAPIERVDAEGQRLIQRLSCFLSTHLEGRVQPAGAPVGSAGSSNSYDSGYSSRD